MLEDVFQAAHRCARSHRERGAARAARCPAARWPRAPCRHPSPVTAPVTARATVTAPVTARATVTAPVTAHASAGVAPEFVRFDAVRGMYNGQNHNLLRPETAESLFILWRVTKDPLYREQGWAMFLAFDKWCRVPVRAAPRASGRRVRARAATTSRSTSRAHLAVALRCGALSRRTFACPSPAALRASRT